MRELLNKISAESSIFVALGVYSLVQLTAVLYSLDIDVYANFTFFATLNVYAYSIIYSNFRLDRAYLFSLKNIFHKLIFILSAVITVFYLIKLDIDLVLMLIPLAAISYLYPVGVRKQQSDELTLRELPYVKIFLISVSWAFVTFLIPVYSELHILNAKIFTEFMVRIAFVMAITIPFDIRDVNSDSYEMKTLPQILGVKKAKNFAYALILLNVLFYFFRGGSYSYLPVFLVFSFVFFLISKSNKVKDLYFFNIIIESSSILLFISIML